MVLDGRVDRDSPARTSGAASEQSLEQSLGAHYGEAVTSELLRRLRSIYSLRPCPVGATTAMDGAALPVDVQALRVRLEDLCQWRWAGPHVAARLLWATAWLNELMGRMESAAGYYDAFLQTSCREEHLRLLAYNNRGVLRIQLGRLEGVQDLLRAAVPTQTDGAGPAWRNGEPGTGYFGLPDACFNLLNLLNVSLFVESLTQPVDEELADFFSQLPEEVRTCWLGSDPSSEQADGQASEATGAGPDSRILRSSNPRRMNTLMARLSLAARELAVDEADPDAEASSPGGDRLSLWDCRTEDERAGGNGEDVHSSVADRCAEAAGLLLSDDIPAVLIRSESPLSRAEQLACEELADVEGRVTIHQRELTKSRLRAQRRILSSLNRRGRLEGLLARIDAQLDRVARREMQEKHLDLQRTCARLVDEVERFCRISDPCLGDRERHDLIARLTAFRSACGPQADREILVLLDELTARVERHMQRLQRLEVRRRIRKPLRHLRRDWPSDWTTPVPESLYEALAQCQLNDPENWIENWSDWRTQLDAHQAQFHMRKALMALQEGPGTWGTAQADLVAALSLRPELWLTVAPLFGYLPAGATSESAPNGTDTWTSLQASAMRLFQGKSPSGEPQEDRDRRLAAQAGELLRRVFAHLDGDPRKAAALWGHVEASMSPVLARTDGEAIEGVKALAAECLAHWPAGSAESLGRADPRHPVNLFLERCEKAAMLWEAERLLTTQPTESAGRYAELLEAGADTRDQLRRILTGLYLAGFREGDPAPVQREVLSRLEAWVAALPVEAGRRLRPEDFRGEMERIRAAVCTKRPASVATAGASDGSPQGTAEHISKAGELNTTDGSERDHRTPQEEQNQPER